MNLHQDVFREEFQKYQVFTWDIWTCGEAKLKRIFHTVLFMSMFKGGFSPCGFASFLVLYGHIVCKGWLSLVSRTYIYDIFLILYINKGLVRGVGIIKTHPKT